MTVPTLFLQLLHSAQVLTASAAATAAAATAAASGSSAAPSPSLASSGFGRRVAKAAPAAAPAVPLAPAPGGAAATGPAAAPPPDAAARAALRASTAAATAAVDAAAAALLAQSAASPLPLALGGDSLAGERVPSSGSGERGMVLGTVGFTTGVHYWEVRVDQQVGARARALAHAAKSGLEAHLRGTAPHLPYPLARRTHLARS